MNVLETRSLVCPVCKHVLQDSDSIRGYGMLFDRPECLETYRQAHPELQALEQHPRSQRLSISSPSPEPAKMDTPTQHSRPRAQRTTPTLKRSSLPAQHRRPRAPRPTKPKASPHRKPVHSR